MTKEEKNKKLQSIKSMFLTNSVKKMRDIEKVHPTLITASLKTNHSRFIQKLHNPELFTFKQIKELADLLELDMDIIYNVIRSDLYRSKIKR